MYIIYTTYIYICIYIYVYIYIYMIFWLKDSSEAKGIQLLLVLCWTFFFEWSCCGLQVVLSWRTKLYTISQALSCRKLGEGFRRIRSLSNWSEDPSWVPHFFGGCGIATEHLVKKNQREHRKTITWMWISLHIRFIDIHNHFGAHKWNLYEVYGL